MYSYVKKCTIAFISSSHHLFERMAPDLFAGVGAVASVMSKFVHPSKPIHNNYLYRPKKHKLGGVVLVEEDKKVVRRGAYAITVLSSPMPVFLTKKYMPPSNTSM